MNLRKTKFVKNSEYFAIRFQWKKLCGNFLIKVMKVVISNINTALPIQLPINHRFDLPCR